MVVWLAILPQYCPAATPGVVVGNSGGKDTLQFQEWQDFRRNVDEKSNGAILLDYLIFGELGTAQAMLQAVISGRADIGSFSCAGATETIPELAVTSLPFLFDSEEEAGYVFDKYLLPLFTQIADQHGLVLLQWSDYSWFDVYARAPVELPGQLEQRQVRSPRNISGPDYIRALGATPVQLTTADLASSTQNQKVFAMMGNEQGFVHMGSSNFKYYTLTHHAYNCGLVVANKTWFQSNSVKDQAILRSSFPPVADIRQTLREQNRKDLVGLPAMGVHVIDLTPEERNAWAAAGLPLYSAIIREAGGRSLEVYDAIRAGKRDFLLMPSQHSDHK
jgi:C4-dicarboxylate-binding protein DctP